MEKEPLSIMIVKTLLAVIIFAGMWIIIIGGAWLIGKQGKVKALVIWELGVIVDGHFKRVSNIELPISETEAKTIVKEFCEPENQDNAYGYDTIKEADNEWRIPITNLNCPCYATVNIETGETNCMKEIPFGIEKQITIATDKTEYEQGETVEITVKNNLDNLIKHLKGVGCGLQGFSNKNKEWINVSPRSCKWDGENKLKPNSEYNFNWTIWKRGLEKYRIAFNYQEQKVIETKEKAIGKIICENKNLPDELEELLLNGRWVKNDIDSCDMCHACFVCSCTIEDAWSINEVLIDVTYVSCAGSSYTIKYKGEEYNCVSENYKQQILAPSENWETIYSNEFTVKEKSAFDPRCDERVRFSGNCEIATMGIEFDSNIGKCVIKGGSCKVETPFKTLEECQEVCEKKDMSCEQATDCIEKCPKCVDKPQLRTNCAPRFKCVNGTCECECVCLSM